MQPAAWVQFHPFAKTLKSWEQGVPVDCGPEWSPDTCGLAIEKGSHRGAMTAEAIELVHEDVKYQVDTGFSRIVLWDDIKHNPPAKLKVSPLAVIPQTNRRGQLILDLSFPVHRTSKSSKRKLGQVVQEA
eukprot:scaffold119933_cov29-Attheya_sp.AAC.6